MTTSSTTATPTASPESPILRYVTIADAADRVGVGIYPIHQLAHEGRVRAVRYGEAILVSLDDVLAREDELWGESLAAPEAVAALELPLRIVNDVRGTQHTVESLAKACGVDLENGASNGDVDLMASHIGGVLMAEAR